jgi:hypothetical protein
MTYSQTVRVESGPEYRPPCLTGRWGVRPLELVQPGDHHRVPLQRPRRDGGGAHHDAVFAGFITAGESMIKMIGFGLAIAVLFDAFVVRVAFVPAVLALLGDKVAWLPGWLDRVLPNIDVEGEALSRQHATHRTRTSPPTRPGLSAELQVDVVPVRPGLLLR